MTASLSAQRCAKKVYIAETYRRTGRGPSGFEMNYIERMCSRNALPGKDMCWQHDSERGMAAYMKATDTWRARRRWSTR